MKRIVTSFILSILCTLLMAVPARRTVFTHTQSDGTVLTLMLVGDEHLHYYINTKTEEKMQRGDDGDYYVISDEEFEALQNAAQERLTQINSARLLRLSKRRSATTNGPRRIGAVDTGISGSKKGLVILVNYSDLSMAEDHTQTAFDDMFNKEGYDEGGHVGSVHDYFYDQSYGQFDLTFDVVGPVTVSNTMSYYGSNDSSGNDKHPGEMVSEACQLVDEQVNFADYDWDNDGEVDQVFVIYAGYGEASGASSNTIWPHEWDLYDACGSALTLDEVKIDTYACSCELSGTSGSTINGIGTACHEFSHCLGYPDFYDTSYKGGFGMSYWDLMASGSYNGPHVCGEVPAGFTSYERWMAGWLTPTELTEPTAVTGMKCLGDSPEAYIIYNDKNADEYILLENHQNDKWLKYFCNLPTAHGLLAIHVDYNKSAWEKNKPNNNATHQRMTIIPSSGIFGMQKTSSSGLIYYNFSKQNVWQHPFGGTSPYTSLTATTHTDCGGTWFTACSTGSKTLNHEVTDITNAEDGTISFLFDEQPSTVTFESGTGNCEVATLTEDTYLSGITLPAATGINDDWTFVGWSTESIESATTTKPTTILQAGSTYTPGGDITLYAVYQHTEDQTINGFTLDLTYKDIKYYIGSANSTEKKFDASTEEGMTLYFSDGYLWYENDGTKTYVYCDDTNAELLFTASKSDAKSYLWTEATENDSISFSTADSRYIGLDLSSKTYMRAYKHTSVSKYPYLWNLTPTTSTSAIGTTTNYETYPSLSIEYIVRLVKELNDGTSSKSVDDVNKYVDKLLER